MIKRNTIQKTMVLDAVRTLHNHATADEVYDFCHLKYPHISRATVYRDLAKLCESGQISRREIPNSPDRYDHLTTNHYHIICTKCGKVVDVEMPYQSEIEKQVTNTNGFVLTGHNITFTGICKDCQNKK